MNVGDPNCRGEDHRCRRESDMPVVVMRAGKVKARNALQKEAARDEYRRKSRDVTGEVILQSEARAGI